MHPIFVVTKEEIQQLDDTQARALIARVCEAEVRAAGFSSSAVTWGGDQRAKDGGVDVRVEIRDATEISGYIPRVNTVFQVKAVKTFGDSAIGNEMAPSKQLLPAIAELATNGGAYIIASTKGNESDSALISRKAAMQACIDNAQMEGEVIVDFYDAQKIATWVEQYPAVVVWLKSALGMPIVGWQPYATWAYRECDIDAEYILDDKVKIIDPSNKPVAALDAINELRRNLKQEKSSVRIVGLSGVGKTRLAQALFDNRIMTAVAELNRNNVIYTDLSNNPTQQPNALIAALLVEKADAVVIIDNCGSDTHSKLTELIQHSNSRLRLLTIEYDIRDDLPEDTKCYRLDTSSDELIKTLLASRFADLTRPDIDKIAEFSSGNARIAFALAGTSESKGQLAKLESAELFKRLFWQKNIENDDLLHAAEVCSLLYSFDGESDEEGSELALLASLVDMKTVVLSRHVAELKRRGLLQQRGRWRAVLPHAIANRLAMSALENYPQDTLIRYFVSEAAPRLAKSFSRRLSYLYESNVARDIAAELLNVGGICADLAQLNEVGQQVFINTAPVNQGATIDALQRASLCDEFVSVKHSNRWRFSRVAQSLAYEASFFDQAIAILVCFAAVEPQDLNQNSARSELKSLFGCYLSGTLASPSQRVGSVKRLIESGHSAHVQIGLDLLGSALKAGHFSSYGEFGFGAHQRGYGWQPRTIGDEYEWYGSFIAVANEFGVRRTTLGAQVRKKFADQFCGLWVFTSAALSEQLVLVAELFYAVDGWLDGWIATRLILMHHKERLSDDAKLALRQLEVLLAPKNLIEKIRVRVLSRSEFICDVDEEEVSGSDRYEKSAQEVEQLGRLAGADESMLIDLLPVLLRRVDGNNVFSFACGVAQTFGDISQLFSIAKNVLAGVEESERNLSFVHGALSAWYKVDVGAVAAFLDEAVADSILGQYFPGLQTQVDLDDAAYRRLFQALDLGLAPTWQFNYLQSGSVTAPLSAVQVVALVSQIAKKPDGAIVAISVLDMVIHGARFQQDSYRQELAERCGAFFMGLDWQALPDDNQNLVYHLNEIIEFVLQSEVDESRVSLILQRLISSERTRDGGYYSNYCGIYLKPFFKYYPKLTLDLIYQPDDDGQYKFASALLENRYSEMRGQPFVEAPADFVLEWCEVSPNDRFAFVAQGCSVFKSQQAEGDDGVVVSLSDLAKGIFSRSAEKELILNLFIERFTPSCWSGSLAAIIRSRIPVLDELCVGQNELVVQMVSQAKNKLVSLAAEDEKREAQRERERNECFE